MDQIVNGSQHFIGGSYRKGQGQGGFENRSPVDGSLIGEIPEAGRADVDEAVNAARDALKGPWGRMSAADRTAVLYRVAEGIRERFDAFAEAECRDTGMPQTLARTIDVPRGAANFEIFADLVKNVPDEAFHMQMPTGAQVLNYSVRKPKGVVAVICPWNLPLLLMTWKVGPALACGNTVIVKPSEETPSVTAMLGEVMNEAGVPPGVFNVLQGLGGESTGEFLTSHPGIDAITFTGETVTGEAIMKAASVGLRDVSFELGGKNPAIVFADADLDKAIDGTTRSAFANCGQVCLGTERIYVERSLFDAFVEKLTARAKGIKIGPPQEEGVTMGPLISHAHRQKVLSYYDKARTDGATIVIGGGVPDMPDAFAEGSWIEPTIWTGLPGESPILREEIFGPCCHIAPFDDEEEVVKITNDTPYGLCAAVWTRDMARGHRVAAALDVGITWVNSWFLRDLRTPFGGMKHSGIGREGGEYSLEFYTETKNICVKL